MVTLDKQQIVNSILESLNLDSEPNTVLSENLNKMSKPTLTGLASAIADLAEVGPESKHGLSESELGDLPYTPVPLNLVAADVKMPKKPDGMLDQLKMLPVIGDRLAIEFERGNFPAIKRNIGNIDTIVNNCRRMIAKQLWDSVSIYEGMPEPDGVPETDDE